MVKLLLQVKIIVALLVEAFHSVGQSLGLINIRDLPAVNPVSQGNANYVDVLALSRLVTDRLMQLNPIRSLLLVVIL